jgi:hypothetical protein
MIIGTTNLVINEIGAVFNVRIEGDTDANLFYTDATNDKVGVGTASPAEKLDVVGNIKLSGNVIVASGQGIDFSATPGTGTSELLADYEEGTFTGTMTPSTSGTITLDSAVNTLTYTKMGRVITITGMLQVSSVSLPVGTYVSVNLPYAISNIGPYASRVGNTAVASQPAYTNKVLLGVENTSAVRMYIDASTIVAGNQFSFSFNYVAA